MGATVSGQVKRVTFESEQTGFRVLRVETENRGVITAVGTFQFVSEGTNVRLTGSFETDPRHGEQFRVHTMVTVEPNTIDGIEKYLGSGLIPGVGPGFAKRIVAAFGLDTLNVLDNHPERLADVNGLGVQRRIKIVEHWRAQRGRSQLMLLLQSLGVSAHFARRIMDRYGDESARIVQNSPYRLAIEVSGIGFATADRIAEKLGISRDHPERAQAGVQHQLRLQRDQGHVCVPREQLVQGTAGMLQVQEPFVEAGVDALWAAERVVVDEGLVYLRSLHRAEVGIADQVNRLSEFPAPALVDVDVALKQFAQRHGIQLAEQQRAAVQAVADEKVVVITGGPGVGKTTIVRAVLMLLQQAGLQCKLAAPTGRAAKRLSESTASSAVTLHRLLEYDPRLRRFARDRDNPLEAQAVIVDEASMIDLGLGQALLSAMPDPARLIVVGDVDQLPSVGPGAVLRDLIDSKAVAVVRLNEIFRQGSDSKIVSNAHAILRGQMPMSAADGSVSDFYIVERKNAEKAAQTVEELVVRRIPQRFGFDPMTDIQVLSPMHKGASGAQALNRSLQAALNPHGQKLNRPGQSFRVGDRVMQLRNDYDKDVFNGDVGRVVAIDEDESELEAEFDGRRVTFSDSELETLSLAYATSIHKSQGSEYTAIVVPFLTAHYPMLSRNLLYTAVTRARKLCVLVADPRAVSLALSETRKEQRNTRLIHRLRGISVDGII